MGSDGRLLSGPRMIAMATGDGCSIERTHLVVVLVVVVNNDDDDNGCMVYGNVGCCRMNTHMLCTHNVDCGFG